MRKIILFLVSCRFFGLVLGAEISIDSVEKVTPVRLVKKYGWIADQGFIDIVAALKNRPLAERLQYYLPKAMAIEKLGEITNPQQVLADDLVAGKQYDVVDALEADAGKRGVGMQSNYWVSLSAASDAESLALLRKFVARNTHKGDWLTICAGRLPELWPSLVSIANDNQKSSYDRYFAVVSLTKHAGTSTLKEITISRDDSTELFLANDPPVFDGSLNLGPRVHKILDQLLKVEPGKSEDLLHRAKETDATDKNRS